MPSSLLKLENPWVPEAIKLLQGIGVEKIQGRFPEKNRQIVTDGSIEIAKKFGVGPGCLALVGSAIFANYFGMNEKIAFKFGLLAQDGVIDVTRTIKKDLSIMINLQSIGQTKPFELSRTDISDGSLGKTILDLIFSIHTGVVNPKSRNAWVLKRTNDFLTIDHLIEPLTELIL